MRPKSIVTFERLALLSLAVALILAVLTWRGNIAALEDSRIPTSLLWVSYAIGFGLGLLLIFLISRRGSNVAKWILVVLTAIGVVEMLTRVGDLLGGGIAGIAELGHMLLLAAALYFLFREDSKAWFERGDRPADPVA
jgi:hypothetical protein